MNEYERRIQAIQQRLAELDKLRGTGYWDFHYDCLWHSLYKRELELKLQAGTPGTPGTQK